MSTFVGLGKYAVTFVGKGFILVALPVNMFLTETRIWHHAPLHIKTDAGDSHL